MTKPLHVSRSQAKRLERNLSGEKAKAKRTTDRRVTLRVAPDVKPETLAALVSLAMRVMDMPEAELREFLKKTRKL